MARQLTAHLYHSLLPAVEKVSMETITYSVVEGVHEPVPRLHHLLGVEDGLVEERGQPPGVGGGTAPCRPASAWVDHGGVGVGEVRGQPPVPAAGEGDLGADAAGAALGPRRELGRVRLLGRHAQALVVDEVQRSCLRGTAGQHSGVTGINADADFAETAMLPEAWRKSSKVSRLERIVDEVSLASVIDELVVDGEAVVHVVILAVTLLVDVELRHPVVRLVRLYITTARHSY